MLDMVRYDWFLMRCFVMRGLVALARDVVLVPRFLMIAHLDCSKLSPSPTKFFGYHSVQVLTRLV